jgi:hypothetical protein
MTGVFVGERLAGAPRPACAGASPAWLLRRVQALGDLFGLLEIVVRGAPEEEASGHAPDGDGELQLCGHAEEAVFHRGRAGAWKDGHSDGGLSQRLDLSLERLIEHGVHARAPTHRAGFV